MTRGVHWVGKEVDVWLAWGNLGSAEGWRGDEGGWGSV